LLGMRLKCIPLGDNVANDARFVNINVNDAIVQMRCFSFPIRNHIGIITRYI